MTKWEYKVLTYPISEFRKKLPNYQEMEAELNSLGAAGWEILNAVAPGRGQGQATEVVLIARRPAAA
ncbi:hypothetical protein BJY24_004991 [Nocardia transvalensis]|uniref:DUF4177 domain-containing protein n=1 Tax=Nocardia transvalensis TaxID=37333 RepID=A0A7W9PI90_9NOCA|nr:DUF4177 domain-containing protein [Nocardia transvalensis]MBB5916079.1 hypothetical protein [Nocardia transvalensis]